MKITLTPQESEEYFHNSLCNALGYMSGYGIELDFEKDDYDKAKLKLTTGVCYEDVLMQILKDGGKLKFIDEEGEGDMTREITMKDVHEKVQLTPTTHLMDMINENDDATTSDVILQTVFFGEIVFG